MEQVALAGADSEGEPPVPIPNTEVKPFIADGTAGFALWESRKAPLCSYSDYTAAGRRHRKAGSLPVFLCPNEATPFCVSCPGFILPEVLKFLPSLPAEDQNGPPEPPVPGD